ncbi:WD40/YVTN/BNR-like repeat-containing protein [Kaarinaea lacus]
MEMPYYSWLRIQTGSWIKYFACLSRSLILHINAYGLKAGSTFITTGITTVVLGICFLLSAPTLAASDIYPQSVVSFETWSTNGPEGGHIAALAVDPDNTDILYVASRYSGGVYKSSDGGSSWTNVGYSADTSWNIVNDLVIDPNNSNNIFVATTEGVFKSTNGGMTWSAVKQGLSDPSTQGLAFDPAVADKLYAGTSSGVFVSVDSGNNWSALGSLPGQAFIHEIAINPDNSDVIYAASAASGVYKSTDGGDTWNTMNTGLGSTEIKALVMDPANPETLYVGIELSGVFKTTNGGTNWTATNIDKSISSLAINPDDTAILYAGTFVSGVYKTTDGGLNWAPNSSDLPGGTDYLATVNVVTIDPATTDTIYIGTWGFGVYKSTNGATDWTAINHQLVNTYIYSLATDPRTPGTAYAGTDLNGLFKTNDGGMSWEALDLQLPRANNQVLSIAVDPLQDGVVYAGINTRFTDFSGYYKSIDGGATWDALDLGVDTVIWPAAIAIDSQQSNTLYAGIDAGPVDSGIYKTVDGGINWARTSMTHSIRELAIDPTTPSTLYAVVSGSSGEVLYKSIDGGLNWTDLSSNLPDGFLISALAIDPNQPQTLYVSEISLVGIYKSIDGGETWNAVNNGLTNKEILDLLVVPGTPSAVLAGTRGGVFVSADGGDNWTIANTGLTHLAAYELAVDTLSSIQIYAGTLGGGVFTSSVTIEPDVDNGGNGGGDGNCFIATAAYGSYLHKDVVELREFRDEFLLTNAFGKKFVAFYYEYSPPVANYIAQHESIRVITRWLLTPLVMTVKYPFGAAIIVMIMVVGIRRVWRLKTAQGAAR